MSAEIYIGRYRIIKEIGRGAMSVVFQAEDPDIGRSLAIKLLKHELNEQDEYRDLFLSEAKSAGRLSHPSIVTIYDMGIWNDRPFIAMELFEGQTLDEYLFEKGTLPLEQLIDFSRQMTQALEYAHRSGVIHRDLKPENIFVLNDGKHFKIADFGIAKIESDFLEKLATNQSEDPQASKEKVMGTPAYMSPEQVTGHGVDGKTDFYSLGVILYQATKGELPFKAVNYAAMMKAVLQQNPQPLEITDESGLSWQSIVFRLLQKNPELRYDHPNTLLGELSALENEVAENQKGLSGLRFVSMKSRWAVGLSAVVFVVMTFGIYWVYQQQTELMKQLMYDYGFSVSQIIAKEAAEPLLLEEDLTLQSITDKISENPQILSLTIRDNENLIKSSSNQLQVGTELVEHGVLLVDSSNRGKVFLDEETFSTKAFIFDSAIRYQNKPVGTVSIAISRSNLQQAIGSSLLAMVIWMLVILLVVFVGIYWLANRFTSRINHSRRALRDLRLHSQTEPVAIGTHDEVGRLQQELNLLSQKLAGLTRTQRITLVEMDPDLEQSLQQEIAEEDLDKTLVIQTDFKSSKE